MIALFLAELDQNAKIVQLSSQPDHSIDLGLQGRQPRGHPLRIVRVVPQIGSGHLLLQLGDLRTLAIGVDDSLNRAQCLVKVSECDGEVGSGHNDPLYVRASLPVLSAQSALVSVRSRPHCAVPRYGRTAPRRPSGAAASR